MGFGSFGSAVLKGLNESIGPSGLGDAIRDPVGKLKRGAGKGTLGHWTEQIYGGTTKDIFDQLQGKGDEGDDQSTAAPDLSAGEVDPDAELGALQDILIEKHGRTAMNLAPASGSSILSP